MNAQNNWDKLQGFVTNGNMLFLFTQGNFSLSIYQDTTSYPKKK